MQRIIQSLIVIAAVASLPFIATAQIDDLEAVLTWRADAYAPASYLGKVMPTRNTDVAVHLTLLDNGKAANLANREIRWFVNGQYYHKGTGLTTFTFTVPIIATGAQTVVAEVIGYQGSDVRGTVVVPFTEPFVVIDAPVITNLLEPAVHVLKALPYSFNAGRIADFEFRWTANNTLATGDPGNASELVLDLSRGTAGANVEVSARATNTLAPIESAKSIVTFSVR